MSIKTMQLGVSKNLLTKVPRYFGAPNAIFASFSRIHTAVERRM